MNHTDLLLRGYSSAPRLSLQYFGSPAPSLIVGLAFEQDRSSLEERLGYRLKLYTILRQDEIYFTPGDDEDAYIVVSYYSDDYGHWAYVLYPFWLGLPKADDAAGADAVTASATIPSPVAGATVAEEPADEGRVGAPLGDDASSFMAPPDPDRLVFVYEVLGAISDENPEAEPIRPVSDLESYLYSIFVTSLIPVPAIPRERISSEEEVREIVAQLLPEEELVYPPYIERIVDRYDRCACVPRYEVSLRGAQLAGAAYLEGGHRLLLDLGGDLCAEVTKLYQLIGYDAVLIQLSDVPRWGYLGYFILQQRASTVEAYLAQHYRELMLLGAVRSSVRSWDERISASRLQLEEQASASQESLAKVGEAEVSGQPQLVKLLVLLLVVLLSILRLIYWLH
nr:hypothetical protein [uncultured Porphyromonas sp.]